MKTDLGQYVFFRQRELLLDLVEPHAGERVLFLCCGKSEHLQIFREKWCLVTNLDCSEELPVSSRRDMQSNKALNCVSADGLPYADDEFDIVAIINALETAKNPQRIIAEAIRVCSGRVFIGFLNKRTVAGTKRCRAEIFGISTSAQTRFFSRDEIMAMIKNVIDCPSFKWGSVIYFPAIVYEVFTELEEMFPHIKNPLGAFAGLIFPVKYTYRTAQSPLFKSYPIKNKAQIAAPEAFRGHCAESDK